MKCSTLCRFFRACRKKTERFSVQYPSTKVYNVLVKLDANPENIRSFSVAKFIDFYRKLKYSLLIDNQKDKSNLFPSTKHKNKTKSSSLQGIGYMGYGLSKGRKKLVKLAKLLWRHPETLCL